MWFSYLGYLKNEAFFKRWLQKYTQETEKQKVEEDFHCFECEDTFKRKGQLMKHAREKHNLLLYGENIFSRAAWNNPAY